jgi:hypothetical protein
MLELAVKSNSIKLAQPMKFRAFNPGMVDSQSMPMRQNMLLLQYKRFCYKLRSGYKRKLISCKFGRINSAEKRFVNRLGLIRFWSGMDAFEQNHT